MNDAIYKLCRYEDSSLIYTGVNRHEGEGTGLFNRSLSEMGYLEAKYQGSTVTVEGYAWILG